MKVLIYVETKDGNPLGGSLELISAGKALGADLEAILIGSDVAQAAEITAEYAPVLVVDVEAPVSDDVLTDVLYQAAAKGAYDLILASSTNTSKAILPRLAGKLDAGYISDITSVEPDAAGFSFTRPAYGGTVYEQRKIKGSAVATVRAGSFEKLEAGEKAAISKLDITADEAAIKTKIVEILADTAKTIDIEAAKIVVAAGRGVGNEKDFPLVQELADALGGVVGGSRPLIENALLPRQQQVGQSGKIVTPDLYIAVAVSGAPQHIAGMSGSKYIVAINRDEDAPIFNVADVGIVGDAKKILPLLIEAVKTQLSS